MYPRWLSISLSMRELSGAAASPSLETLLLSSSGPSRRIEEGSRTGGRRRTRGVGGIRHAERRPHHRGADRLGALVRARGVSDVLATFPDIKVRMVLSDRNANL